MPTLGGTDIFICNSVKKIEKMYEEINACIREEYSCEMNIYRTIDNDELWNKIGKNEIVDIRFACITDQTRSNTIGKLYENCIPILLIDSGKKDVNSKEYLRRHIFDISEEEFNRMIYNVEKPDQITGAINWVHACYYRFLDRREKDIINRSYQKSQSYEEDLTARILQEAIRIRGITAGQEIHH